MDSNKLSTKLKIQEDYFKYYPFFEAKFINSDALYFNKDKIYLDVKNKKLDVPYIFWHLISLGDEDLKEKFPILPCINSIASDICKYECDIKSDLLYNQLLRVPCHYRARKVTWIIDILNLINTQCEHIKIWEIDNKDKKNGATLTKTKIRFTHDTVDYIIILGHMPIGGKYKYKLITAFPIIFKGSRNKYNKQYEKYVKK